MSKSGVPPTVESYLLSAWWCTCLQDTQLISWICDFELQYCGPVATQRTLSCACLFPFSWEIAFGASAFHFCQVSRLTNRMGNTWNYPLSWETWDLKVLEIRSWMGLRTALVSWLLWSLAYLIFLKIQFYTRYHNVSLVNRKAFYDLPELKVT